MTTQAASRSPSTSLDRDSVNTKGDRSSEAGAFPGNSCSQLRLDEARRTGAFGELRGRSPPMLELYDHIRRVAPTNATVLLAGETGTGKEVVARTIHDLSDRRGGAFVALNCGAVSVTLMESELFGHEQGSFTGANRRHSGVFARADGGTLFLDEISEMPLDLQVKLLRVLETGEFQRVGGENPVQVDARVIAATNRVPEQAVRLGRLREDLFYRLHVFPISLPSLRCRTDDIQLLADHFLERLNREAGTKKRLAARARERLMAHGWPGNVRELCNTIRRAYIMATADLDESDLMLSIEGNGHLVALPVEAGRNDGSVPHAAADEFAAAAADGEATVGGASEVRLQAGMSIADAERLLIEATLALDGNKTRAAKQLGISLKTLYSRLQVYAAMARSPGSI